MVGARRRRPGSPAVPARACGRPRCGVVDLHRQPDVLRRGQERDQVGLLEDEAQVLAAEGAHVDGARGPSNTGVPPMAMRPVVGGWISADGGQQRGLARAAGAEQATISPRATASVASRTATTSVWPLP